MAREERRDAEQMRVEKEFRGPRHLDACFVARAPPVTSAEAAVRLLMAFEPRHRAIGRLRHVELVPADRELRETGRTDPVRACRAACAADGAILSLHRRQSGERVARAIRVSQIDQRLQLVGQKVRQVVEAQAVTLAEVVLGASMRDVAVSRAVEARRGTKQRREHVEVHRFRTVRASVLARKSSTSLIDRRGDEIVGRAPRGLFSAGDRVGRRQQPAEHLPGVERVAAALIGIGEAAVGALDAHEPFGELRREFLVAVGEQGRNEVARHFGVRVSMARLDADAAARQMVGANPRQRARGGGLRHARDRGFNAPSQPAHVVLQRAKHQCDVPARKCPSTESPHGRVQCTTPAHQSAHTRSGASR